MCRVDGERRMNGMEKNEKGGLRCDRRAKIRYGRRLVDEEERSGQTAGQANGSRIAGLKKKTIVY